MRYKKVIFQGNLRPTVCSSVYITILCAGEVIMAVLPPVSTKGISAENVTELTENVRHTMLQAFERISKTVEDKARENNNCALLDMIQKSA